MQARESREISKIDWQTRFGEVWGPIGVTLPRVQAKELGLGLTPHGLFNISNEPVDVLLDATASLAVRLPPWAAVPYAQLSSEEAILRVLARGTEAFAHLYHPCNRNA